MDQFQGDNNKATEYLENHLKIAVEIGDRGGEGRAYGSLGNAYKSLGDYRKAIEYHKKQLKIAIEIGDRGGEGGAYGNLGNAYRSLGDYRKAIEYHEKRLKIAIETGDRGGEGKAYGNLGNAYDSLGDYRKAIQYHEKRLKIAIEIGDRGGEGGAYGSLGNAHKSLGDYRKAIEYHEKQLKIAIEIGDRDGEGRAYANLSIAHRSLGDYRNTIEYSENHLKIAIEIGDRCGEGGAYGDLGNAYHSMGDYGKAIEYREKHLQIAIEIGDRCGERNAYGNLGITYHSLGNYRNAIKYHKKTLKTAKDIGDRGGERKACGNLGIACMSVRKYREAIEYLKRDLEIAIEIGDRGGEGGACGNLGNAYKSLCDYRNAIEHHEKHLKIAIEIGDRDGEGKAYGNLGIAYQLLGDSRKALECFGKCLKIAREIGDQAGEGRVYHNIGRVYFSLEEMENAVDNFISAVNVFNSLRSLLKSKDHWKIDFREQHEATYSLLWVSLLRMGEIDEALFVAEQGRAQTLANNLLIQYKLNASLSSATIDIKETIFRLLAKLSSPILFLAIEGFTTNIWFLRKGKKVIFRKGRLEGDRREEDPLLALLQSCLKKIGAESKKRCEDLFKPFYDAVIDPILDMLEPQDDELVIVPSGVLCFTPWAAVIESIRIRTVPSLTSYQLILSVPEGHHMKKGALLVGNPCLKDLKKTENDLPCAQEEVEMIASILKTRPLTGKRATKAEVMKQMSSVGLIHIAAHGNEHTGEIALSPNPGWSSKFPQTKDYMLKMSDVQAANLRARLVVLSCCYSGKGRMKNGEGVVGIARAFLAAGARSVLVTLWDIDDEATKVFMKSFYQHLKEGKTASAAVQQSMKFLRESEEFYKTRYWAPFQLIGDDVKIEFEADDDIKK
ncbi:uncharacterized protein LOC141883582 [Acropora palmata]|uniref:uncharacterized protein LOC141883582 n=1 Tax=Acropora palmata TaxID=6131 RepID=UPI003DA18783